MDLSLPAATPEAPIAPIDPQDVHALEGLTNTANRLSADQAAGGGQRRELLNEFFDAANAAPPVPGLPEPKLPADYQPVPFTRQETNYSCGDASALGVLRFRQAYDGDERSLYKLFDTREKDGTPPENIAMGLTSLGLPSVLKEGMTLDDLRAALRRGDSVILGIQAWRTDESTPWSQLWGDGHYAVLVGMDEHYAYLMDPSTPNRYTYLPLPELLDRWHDYEDRTGTIRRYYQSGIVIQGGTPLPRPADPPESPEPIKLNSLSVRVRATAFIGL